MVSYPMAMVLRFVGLFLNVASFYFLAKLVGPQSESTFLQPYGSNYLAFLVIGIIFQNFVTLSLGSFSKGIRGEQKMGTLELLLMSKTRLGILLLYSAIWEFIWNIFTSTAMISTAVLVFGVKLHVNVLGTLLIILLTITSLVGIGMASAGVIMVTKKGDPITWVLSMVTGFFSGVYYPIDVFPSILRRFSMILPTTHALVALRKVVMKNASWQQIQNELFILVALSFITIPVGLKIFSYGYNRARCEGTLSHY